MYMDTAQRQKRVAPQIRPAGIVGDSHGITAGDLTSSFNPSGRVTPDSIARFTHRGQPVGESTRNWARSQDPPRDPDAVYGDHSGAAENIDMLLRPLVHADRMSKLVDEQHEAQSRRNQLAPVGHGPAPRDPVPVPLEGFGRPTERGESTKATMSSWRDAEPTHPAGEQKNRNYDWAATGIDPTQACFGRRTDKSASAQSTLAPEHRTVLVPKVTADYRSTVDSEVGKPLLRGFENPEEWPDTKLSRNALLRRHPELAGTGEADGVAANEVAVRQLLSSWAEPANATVMPSEVRRDTARAERQRRQHEEQALLYSASQTLDPRGRTVVELAELGDEATARQLVCPSHYVTLGVQSRYFAGGRDLEDIRALAHKCEFGLTDAQIDEVFAETAQKGKTGIEQFKNAAVRKGYM